MKGFIRIIILAFMLSCTLAIWGQETPSKDNVILEKVILEDGYAKVINVTNLSDQKIKVIFVLKDGVTTRQIELNGDGDSVPIPHTDMICSKAYIEPNKTIKKNIILWERQASAEIQTDKELVESVEKERTNDAMSDHSVEAIIQKNNQVDKKNINNKTGKNNDKRKKTLSVDAVLSDFIYFIEDYPSYSLSTINTETETINEHITALKNWKDKDEYVKDKRLNTYIKKQRDEINQLKENINKLTDDFLNNQYKGKELTDRKACEDEIKTILRERINTRNNNLDRLENEINEIIQGNRIKLTDVNWYIENWETVSAAFGSIIILFILFGWITSKKRRKRQRETLIRATAINTQASSDIVVRRKTTSILRAQNVDDVIDNPSYLRIDCNEFCENSAVRVMYIKNTCIKDVYNMYADDLRNPNNPKEDGCMVLGRWVYDKGSDEYYVTLEHIVLPGDDAVFSEYELNFGGKIKLKVTEKLRKLRRETNLQYDLTCWIHSHPGLGVFFSNSDCNVQEQLKHPTHPRFLTAMVVDILTPKQDLGIFTYKRDASVNSKADLKKLYSLEEMFKWAVESERNSFKQEDFFDILSTAKIHSNYCHEVLLSNGAIIDMEMMISNQRSGILGWIHGFEKSQGLKKKVIAITVKNTETETNNELVGCFMVGSHCSIPSIKKAISNYLDNLKFVLIYTTNDGLLTAIPVENKELCTDDSYYGDKKYEDLLIWTRRKR